MRPVVASSQPPPNEIPFPAVSLFLLQELLLIESLDCHYSHDTQVLGGAQINASFPLLTQDGGSLQQSSCRSVGALLILDWRGIEG
ncbi:hypothetical protein I312_103683 [Cryptococcus bacillisporus CA1280]|uniref:Uncharacterized protein n=1 Tax=Cryptococcus decagattii TaxID=1859122 RepID=A0ABZ2AV64_9TREE